MFKEYSRIRAFHFMEFEIYDRERSGKTRLNPYNLSRPETG